eukprot:TRINITY_DN2503_c0_g3_i1.p1 TRINITY_DN2503_c0_g3~~TRINITY_DN2503_c0_g3_i1.p1  ORF type:complete len:663 (+),score=151.67 TRINITY_DN2503_c0_g3_i1:50-2038(+)
MLILNEDITYVFNNILLNSSVSTNVNCTNVLLLVSPGIDSLCTCKILCEFLESKALTYQAVPVENYNDLLEFSPLNSIYSNIFFINCGGSIKIRKFFQPPNNIHIFIIDSNRPIHLCNIYDPQIYVFDDGSIVEGINRLNEANLEDTEDLEIIELSDDEDEIDSELKTDELFLSLKDKLPRLCNAPSWIFYPNHHSMGLDVDSYDVYYEQGEWKSSSSSVISLEVPLKYGTVSVLQLWWCIISLTDKLLSNQISMKEYSNTCDLLRTSLRDVKDPLLKIDHIVDQQLFLLRESSIWRSIELSPYCFASLLLYRQNAESVIKKLLLELGIQIKHSQQQFIIIPPKVRTRFKEKVQDERILGQFNSNQLNYRSFELIKGDTENISASDHVEMLFCNNYAHKDMFSVNLEYLSDSTNLFKHLNKAISLQETLISVVKAMVTQSRVIRFPEFYFAKLTQHDEIEMLGNPSIGLKLSQILQRVLCSTNVPRPIVFAVNINDKMCRIFGLSAAVDLGMIMPNKFGLYFRQVAETIPNIEFEQIAFNGYIIDIDIGHLGYFIDLLAILLRDIIKGENSFEMMTSKPKNSTKNKGKSRFSKNNQQFDFFRNEDDAEALQNNHEHDAPNNSDELNSPIRNPIESYDHYDETVSEEESDVSSEDDDVDFEDL